jgi:DNA polymerase I
MAKKHLIIDTSYLIYKSYFAYPRLTTKTGKPSGAFYGFAKTIIALIHDYRPDTLSFTMDLKEPTWRHLMYDAYKAGRDPANPDMIEQIPVILEWCEALTQNTYKQGGFEADDYVNTIVHLINQHETLMLERKKPLDDGLFGVIEEDGDDEHKDHYIDIHKIREQAKQFEDSIYIFSSDRDLFQLLVYPNVFFLQQNKAKDGYNLFGKQEFVDKYELEPIQWLDYKTLVGDSGDNLRGLDGVGPKTATQFLQGVGSMFVFCSEKKMEYNQFLMGCWVMGERLEKARLESANKKWDKITSQMEEKFELICRTYELSKLSMVPKTEKPTTKYDLNKGVELLRSYDLKSLERLIDHVAGEVEKEQVGLF